MAEHDELLHDAEKNNGEKVANIELFPSIRDNLGTRRIPPLRAVELSRCQRQRADAHLHQPPAGNGGDVARQPAHARRRDLDPQPASRGPPQPREHDLAAGEPGADGRDPHARVHVEIVDCVALRMGWPEFEKILEEKPPTLLPDAGDGADAAATTCTASFLAKSLGAMTMAFGTHVTPMTLETMRPFPALDFVLRGEPEMTLRELIDTPGRQVAQQSQGGQDAGRDEQAPRAQGGYPDPWRMPSRVDGVAIRGCSRMPAILAAGAGARSDRDRHQPGSAVHPGSWTTCRSRATNCCRSTSSACR